MINTFVNAILAPTGMAVVLSLGILKLVDSEPHGLGASLLGPVSYTHLTLPTTR